MEFSFFDCFLNLYKKNSLINYLNIYKYIYIWIAVKISINYFDKQGSNSIEKYTKLCKYDSDCVIGRSHAMRGIEF